MNCKKCGLDLPPGANYCPGCGRKATAERRSRRRGNGQGTILQTAGGRYKAVVTLGYELGPDGKLHRRTRSKTFDKKGDAVAALASLRSEPEKSKAVTFKALYDTWSPKHRAGASTMGNYQAAFKHFSPLWGMQVGDIDVDDLQECLDDCPAGRRTRENMKALVGLMYKYGIPRRLIPGGLNLGPFLVVDGDGAAHRASFTDLEIEKVRRACGIVPGAEEIYCMIYTGFRPSEFLALRARDYMDGALVGGSKTEAGIDRVVTVSPKIRPAIEARMALDGVLFPSPTGTPWKLKTFTERLFYPALEQIGIDNPLVEVGGGVLRHKYTPHSCRHTFATLLKRAAGADKDKLELMGHTSEEMLRYYQDAPLNDLRAITDAI